MNSRQMNKQEYNALKASVRQLVKLAGGPDAASLVTRVGKSNLSDYGNVHRPDVNMPVDIVLDLENEIGTPVVTRELARMNGHLLIEMPKTNSGIPSEWFGHIGRISKECADVVQGLAEALTDGEVSEPEAVYLRREVSEAMSRLAALDHVLSNISNPALHRRGASGGFCEEECPAGERNNGQGARRLSQ